jgi:hypothetical protein
MIGELAQDLINRVTTVPALQGRVGAAVGGTENDPTMAEAPTPFAWVIFANSHPVGDTQNGKRYRQEQYHFSVMLAISYGDEINLLTTSLPILESIAQAVSGNQGQPHSDLWEYHGADLTHIQQDRLVYNLTFSIIGHFQI